MERPMAPRIEPPSIDFKSEAFLRDPGATVAALRASAPVVATRFPLVGNVWITTTYEATARVLKDTAVFTLRKEGGAVGRLRRGIAPPIAANASHKPTHD